MLVEEEETEVTVHEEKTTIKILPQNKQHQTVNPASHHLELIPKEAGHLVLGGQNLGWQPNNLNQEGYCKSINMCHKLKAQAVALFFDVGVC